MAATMKDIARCTGLELATISKYFNGGNVRPENRARIEAAVAKLDYSPNAAARSLKTRHTRTIGVVLPELCNTFMTTIIAHIEDALRRSDYGVIVCDFRSDEAREKEAVSFLLHKQVDGIISLPMCSSGAHLSPALERGVPVVLVDRMVESLYGRVSAVIIDNRNISRRAVETLLAAGHRRIGLILGEKGIYTTSERYKGYTDALRAAGIAEDPALIDHGDYTMQGGYLIAKSMLAMDNPPTALFCTNYEMTLGARIALNEMHVRIPQDLSLIGFDDMDMTNAIFPNTTLVTQPMAAISDCAAERMLSLLSDPETVHQVITLPAALKKGDTVAAQRCE